VRTVSAMLPRQLAALPTTREMTRRRSAGGLQLLLAPGAGASSDASALVAIDDAVMAAGLGTVARMDFPYRLAGRRAPDRLPVLLEAVRARAEEVDGGRLLLGGRSMGGRVCSIAVAHGLPAVGLVLVSYPLHPPGKPDRLRVEHFPDITVPCLFVSGTRDAFGSPEELEHHTRAIPAPVTHVWLDGGDHGLRRRDDATAAAVVDWLRRL
jgi:predicted alpha/beta-hydrolase family hydrolase